MRGAIHDGRSVIDIVSLPEGWTGAADDWRPGEFILVGEDDEARTEFAPTPGLHVVADEAAQIGWPIVDGRPAPPPARAEEPPPPVMAVHVAWLSAALAEAGKLAAVEAAVDAAGPVARALWSRATTIRIDDADVVAIAGALKLDLRALFDRAEDLRGARAR